MHVSPPRVVRFLAIAITALVVIHIVCQTLRLGFGRDVFFGLTKLFDLDREANIPTWFSGFLLGLAAALLGLIGANHRRLGNRTGGQWIALAWIFAFLSLDEVAGVHERLGAILRRASSISHWTHFVWPIPATVLVAVLFLMYRKWFAALERPTRRGIWIAAAVYLGGAIGMEVLSGVYWARQGVESHDLVYTILTTIEETLEMAGMLLFIRVLLDYGSARGWGIALIRTPEPGASQTVHTDAPG